MTRPGLAAARSGWLLLGIVLAIAIQPVSKFFLAVSLGPWLVGAIVLWGPRGGTVVAALSGALRTRAGMFSLLVLSFLLALVSLLFGPLAVLLLACALAVLLFLAATFGTPGRVERMASMLALLLTTLTVSAAIAETVLRLRQVEDQLGSHRALMRMDAAYDSLWASNLFGFRSTHETVRRSPGQRRLLALGDSFTWGDKVAQADSVWPAQLERRLGRDGVPTEVINMGQRGWTTANEAELLRRAGWQFNPDVVLIQYFVNDPFESGPNFARGGDVNHRLVPARLREYGAGRLALTNLLEITYNQWLRGTDPDAMFGPMYARDGKGWQETEMAFREMADSARARGVPAVVILYPALMAGEWTPDTYPLRKFYKQAGDAAAAAGLVVFDLTPVFAAQGGNWNRWGALAWDSHPNEAAHALTADAIATFLEERGLLPPALPNAR